MIILSDLSTDKLRKLYKELKPKMVYSDINRLNKDELIEKFDKVSDKRIEKLIKQMDEKYKEKPIKTIEDYLNSINKYDVRKIAKSVGVSGLRGNKGDVIKGIVEKGVTIKFAKKIISENS
jgi:Mg/Co/Ni transporter MgtE